MDRQATTIIVAVLCIAAGSLATAVVHTAEAGDYFNWLGGYVHYSNATGQPAAGVQVTLINLDTRATRSNVTDADGGFVWSISSGNDWRQNDTLKVVASQEAWQGNSWYGASYLRLSFNQPYILRNITLHKTGNLSIEKTVQDNGGWADKTRVQPGDTVTFQLTPATTNASHTDVHVTDDLPSSLSYTYDATPSPSVATDHHLEWHFPDLQPGDDINITFTAQVAVDAAFGTAVNLANLSGHIPTATFFATDDATITVSLAREGDPTDDGGVDSADLQVVMQHIVGTSTLTGAAFEAADVYPVATRGDGTIDSADAQLIAQHIVGTYTIPA